MKILIYGAGVIGTVYAWQLSKTGNEVSVLVRKGKKTAFENGIPIRCTDERVKGKPAAIDTIFHPDVVEELSPEKEYDWIIVAVKSNQLDEVLPVLASGARQSKILFFQNNWWGDERIKAYLQPEQYLFGFSRLVGGWKNENSIECMIFNGPGMSTMLGNKDDRSSAQLQEIAGIMKDAGLKPKISSNILSWLKFHYIEYLGASGAILKAGSTQAFVDNRGLVKEALLATREGLKVCQARGEALKAAPANLRMFNLPLFLIVPLAQYQYRMPNIQRFFKENITQGMAEISAQYQDMVSEGKRLGVSMPVLSGFEPYFGKAPTG